MNGLLEGEVEYNGVSGHTSIADLVFNIVYLAWFNPNAPEGTFLASFRM